jgi:hypothetical protein
MKMARPSALLELGDVVGRAQDRGRAPSLDHGVVCQRGRDDVLGELLVRGVVVRIGPHLSEGLVAATAEHQRARVRELLPLERVRLGHELGLEDPAAAAVPLDLAAR